MGKKVDFDKIDRLARGYRQSTAKAAYLAEIWGDLTGAEGDALFLEIEKEAEPVDG